MVEKEFGNKVKISVVENVPVAWLRCLAPFVARPQNSLAASKIATECDEVVSLCEGPRGFAGALEADLSAGETSSSRQASSKDELLPIVLYNVVYIINELLPIVL